MSVVILGGHDGMVCRYKEIGRSFKCKIKVFTQLTNNFQKQIGNPDLIILITDTVSHKIVNSAKQKADKTNIKIEYCHGCSCCALKTLLEKHCHS